MTRAADQLHVAQTALGMQIKQLEGDLGVSLFVRHSRGIEPTKAGKLLYERALEILTLVEDARKQVIAVEGDPNETIRLGITPALMAAIGPDIAMAVKDGAPSVFLSMAEAMSHVLTGMLERGEVDFILGYDTPDQPQFDRIALMQDDLFLVTQPQDKAKRTVSLVEAIKNDLAMPEAGDAVRNAVHRAAKDLGLDLKVTYEVRSVSAMKNLVSRGEAVSVLPLFSVADEVQAGTLSAMQIKSPTVSRTLYVTSLRQANSFRNLDQLTDTIRKSLEVMIKRLRPIAPQQWARIL